jgi:phage replication O-like protein O
MASPQLENGHSRVANELLEAILRAPLSARELKVLLTVIRETYGWNRKAKPLSASRVGRMSGMQRTQAAHAIRRLEGRNIVTRTAEGLGIQKDYELWLATDGGSKSDRGQFRPGLIQTGSNLDPSKGSDLDPQRGSESDPYKERGKESKATGDASGTPPRTPQRSPTRFLETLGTPTLARHDDDAERQPSDDNTHPIARATGPGYSAPDGPRPWGSPEALVAAYNAHIPRGHPRVTRLTEGRRKKARECLRQFPQEEFWRSVFEQIRHSRFLRGLSSSEGHRGFRADFDWLLGKDRHGIENCMKVAEGRYRDSHASDDDDE